VNKALGELDLDSLGVSVSAVRRRNIRGVDPQPDTRLEAGDVVVLLGRPAALAAAELRLSGN
jgi:CPA2 family monovalent cation:H+ antiporter-2